MRMSGRNLPTTARSSTEATFPSLGYDPGRELDNPVRRRERAGWARKRSCRIEAMPTG